MIRRVSMESLEGRQLFAAGALGFAFPLGSFGAERVRGHVTDAAGNLYVTGYVGNGTTVDFNPSPRKTYAIAVPFGVDREFLAKYTSAGKLAWATLTPTSGARINTLAVDRQSGDLLAGGEYSGTVNFGGKGLTLIGQIDGSSYGYYGRIDPATGAFTAVKTAMADANCSVTQIESDASGNVYVAGAKGGELYMDSHEVTYPTTSAILIKFTKRDRYVAAWKFRPLDPSGVADLTQDYLDPFQHMAVTPAGQIFLSGVNKTTHPSPLGLSGVGTYLVSLEPGSGGKLFGDVLTGVEAINDLAVDAAGHVLVAGSFAGPADFNIDPAGVPVTLTAGTQTDGYLAKYDPIGRLEYVRQVGLDADATQGDTLTSVAVDDAGYVYVGGSTWGNTYFNPAGTFRFRSGTNREAFVAKYKARGTFMTAWLLGGPASDEVAFLSTAPGPAGAVYATGDLHGVLDANPGRRVFDLTPVADPDLFVVKLG